MSQILANYLPHNAVTPCFRLIKRHHVHLKIVNKRYSRHGDFKKSPSGRNIITVNATANKYQFLITLIHEIAHLVAFEIYGFHIRPHGQEWKMTFKKLMSPFLSKEIFPDKMLPILHQHFENPRASSDTDLKLILAIKHWGGGSTPSNKILLLEAPPKSLFRTDNGKIFEKGKQRTKRFECVELASKRIFLFQPHAEVELLKH